MKKLSKDTYMGPDPATTTVRKVVKKAAPKNVTAEKNVPGSAHQQPIMKKLFSDKDTKSIKKKRHTSNSLDTKKIEKLLLQQPNLNRAVEDNDQQWMIKKKIIQILDKNVKEAKKEGRKSSKKTSAKSHPHKVTIDDRIKQEADRKTAGSDFLCYRHLTPFRMSLESEKIVKNCAKYGIYPNLNATKKGKELKEIIHKKNKAANQIPAANVYMDGLKSIGKNLKDMFNNTKNTQNFKEILQRTSNDDKSIDVVFSRVQSAKTRYGSPTVKKSLLETAEVKKPPAKTKKDAKEKAPSKEKCSDSKIPVKKPVKSAAKKTVNKETVKPAPKEEPEVPEKPENEEEKAQPKMSNNTVNSQRKIFPIIEVEPGKFRESYSALRRQVSAPSRRKSEDSNNSYFSVESSNVLPS